MSLFLFFLFGSFVCDCCLCAYTFDAKRADNTTIGDLCAGILPSNIRPKGQNQGQASPQPTAKQGVSVYFPYSGPFLICLIKMLISTTSNKVNKPKKRKKVVAIDEAPTSLTAPQVGSMS